MRAIKHSLRKGRSGILRFPILALLFLMVLWACQLAQNNKVEDTVSFDALYDSLSKFDSVVIVFKDPQGNLLDTVVKGKVDSHSKIRNLDVKGWDGGKAQIQIFGFDGGQLVYQVDKKYDGTSDQTDANIVVIVPDAAITSDIHELMMASGDSLKYPAITVGPPALSDKSVNWTSSNPGVLYAGPDFIKALLPGSAVLKAQLKVSPSTQMTISVTVNPSNRTPESLAFDHDTLNLAAGGSPGNLAVKASPSNASNAVSWNVETTTIAKVDSNGNVSGISKGVTKLIATSKEKPSLSISAVVVVSDPVSIDKVRFKKNPITIYLGGISEVLAVDVSPSQAIQNVELSVLEPTLAVLNGSALKALAVGTAHVVAKSTADATKSDTLIVTIVDAGKIDSVRIAPRSNQQIYAGGPSVALTGKVFPATAPQEILWKSSNSLAATVSEAGIVTAVESGTAWIFATSQADSSKRDSVSFTVKRDIPHIAFGSDTSLAIGDSLAIVPVITQEFGGIAEFKWDLDGNPGWDDSSSTVKSLTFHATLEKEYQLKLFVRDTEGNEAIATRNVSVGKGPGIAIISPANNSYTNQTAITVRWTVDGALQDTLPKENLKVGANTITRTAKDGSGRQGTASIVVNLDTLKPLAPVLTGPASTSLSPVWHWATGGGGGSGDFRYKLGDADFSQGATQSRDTTFTLKDGLASGTTYTLFVAERDQAGNWSDAAKLAIKYDLTKPTVTILLPQASGLFITPSDTVRISGSSGGSNPIQKVEYSLNGGTLSSIPVGSGGAWVIPNLKLANASTVLIRVVATDNLQNAGEAQLSILRDSTPPAPPTSLSNPSSPTNVSLASWTWSANTDGTGGSGLSGNYRWKVNSGAWTITNLPSAVGTALSEGSNVFAVEEEDKAGNWSNPAADTLILDTKVPDAVTFSGNNNTFTSNRQPTWSWTPSTTNGGIASYSATLDGPDGSKDTTLTTTSYKPAVTLGDGSYKLTVRQRDQVAGVLGAAASFTINVDGTAPIITVSGKANGSTTNLSNANTATLSGTMADDVSGLVSTTWELSGGTTKAPVAVSTPGSFSISIPAMANHATTTVTLKATDKAGNLSTYMVKFAIEVAAPTVAWLPGTEDDSLITSDDHVGVLYSINGSSPTSEVVNLVDPAQPNAFTTNPKTITATNSIGETVSSTRTYFRVYKDIRFFSPTGKSFNNCMSWKNACTFDGSGMYQMENRILWLSSGTYPITTSFNLPEGSTINGQLQTTSRSTTELSASPTILSTTGSLLYLINVRLEYLTFTMSADTGMSAHVLDFGTMASLPGNPWVIIDHCKFDNITGGARAVGAVINTTNNNLNVTVTETTFNNINNPSGPAFAIDGFQNSLTFTRCVFSGIRPLLDIENDGSGTITTDNCTPTKPATYPNLNCTGNVCTSN